MLQLNEFAIEVHKGNVQRGFYDDEKNIGEMLCLIHSEVSEALDAARRGLYAVNQLHEFASVAPDYSSKMVLQGLADPNYGYLLHSDESFQRAFSVCVKDTFEDELADVIIRVLDLCAFKGIDIESHIKAKHRYNSMRTFKHGKNY